VSGAAELSSLQWLAPWSWMLETSREFPGFLRLLCNYYTFIAQLQRVSRYFCGLIFGSCCCVRLAGAPPMGLMRLPDASRALAPCSWLLGEELVRVLWQMPTNGSPRLKAAIALLRWGNLGMSDISRGSFLSKTRHQRRQGPGRLFVSRGRFFVTVRTSNFAAGAVCTFAAAARDDAVRVIPTPAAKHGIMLRSTGLGALPEEPSDSPPGGLQEPSDAGLSEA
jgi:hypothetical protein